MERQLLWNSIFSDFDFRSDLHACHQVHGALKQGGKQNRGSSFHSDWLQRYIKN